MRLTTNLTKLNDDIWSSKGQPVLSSHWLAMSRGSCDSDTVSKSRSKLPF